MCAPWIHFFPTKQESVRPLAYGQSQAVDFPNNTFFSNLATLGNRSAVRGVHESMADLWRGQGVSTATVLTNRAEHITVINNSGEATRKQEPYAAGPRGTRHMHETSLQLCAPTKEADLNAYKSTTSQVLALCNLTHPEVAQLSFLTVSFRKKRSTGAGKTTPLSLATYRSLCRRGRC